MEAEHFFAGASASQSRLGKSGITAVLNTADGGLVYDSACTIQSDPRPEQLAAALVARVTEQSDAVPGTITAADLAQTRNDRRILTATQTRAPAWTVVVSLDHAEFAAPFVALRRQYFGVMGAVLVLALLVVLVGIRNDMRRLTVISRAADAIGHGHFDVWLPPPTGDEIGRVSLALGRMTERLASSLRQIEVSRTMAAVGELATYLSHEIRNPLSSIRLNLQMLRRDLRRGTIPDDGEQVVALCLAELQRLDDVVRTVLEVGRTGPQAGGTCTAHVVIDETLRVMERKFTERDIEVELQREAVRSNVAMSAAALRGIVMNLLLNSIDAVGDRPQRRIVLKTSLLAVPDGELRFELRVADSGPGVPPYLREKIFDPFVTTKPKGNGIGLATVLRAVQECGGVLRHEPSAEWGMGAEFVLELPLAEAVEPATDNSQLQPAGA
jgi:signal transduction histidine kinase